MAASKKSKSKRTSGAAAATPKKKTPVPTKHANKNKKAVTVPTAKQTKVAPDKEKVIEVDTDGNDNDSVASAGSSSSLVASDAGPAGFTDENAKWLKPASSKKKSLFDETDELEEDDDNDDVDDSNSVDSGSSASTQTSLLSIERQSNLLDLEIAAEKDLAEADYAEAISKHTALYHLPSAEELVGESDGTRVVPPSELRERITDVLEVLSDFKARREPDRGRSDYLQRLSADLAELFGYLPELVDYFLGMFGPAETLQFLEASDAQRPVVLRTNTLKTRRKDLAQSLLKRGVNLDPLADWSKVGLKVYESPVPLGATPEYLAGHYMLQSAASMCPVLALDPKPGDKVLDMSAAPGGKTTYVAQLLRNKGMILANDLRPDRQKATTANLHRLGVTNTVVACHDGRKLGVLMKNTFDKVLLDAPCSGLGVISRDPSVKVQRTIADVFRTSHLQKELLLSAVDALKTNTKKNTGGGIMVYSTCSVSVAENEEVVNYLLSKRDVKLVDTGLDFGKPGFTRYQQKRFHPSLVLTRRFYPHVHNMDGFYVCKIMKMSNRKHGDDDTNTSKKKKKKKAETAEETLQSTEDTAMDVVDDTETTADEKDDKDTEMVTVDSTDEKKVDVSDDVVKEQKKSVLVYPKQRKGKKKRQRTEQEEKAVAAKADAGKAKFAVPPRTKKEKKSYTSAKMTKPRRNKL